MAKGSLDTQPLVGGKETIGFSKKKIFFFWALPRTRTKEFGFRLELERVADLLVSWVQECHEGKIMNFKEMEYK